MKHLRLIYFNAPEECEISPLEVHVSVGRVLQGAKTVFRRLALVTGKPLFCHLHLKL